MDDLISRQAAIDAIKNQTCLTYEEIFNRCLTNIRDENGWVGGIKDAIEALIDLPSVQPKLIKAKIGHEPTADETESLKKMLLGEPIVLLPSVEPEIIPLPEIIRCKDCKHYLRPHGCGYIDGMVTAQEDGFCSCAERKTDEKKNI